MALEVVGQQPARAQEPAGASHDGAGHEAEGAEGTSKRGNLSQFIVCGNLFEVDARYVPIKPVGKGAYGVVWCE